MGSILIVTITILGLLLAACQPTATPGGSGNVAGRKVRVGSDTTYPPFESVDPASNAIVGFDPDLMAWIAKDQGFEATFVTTGFDGLFAALAAGEFDAAMSAITITDERKKVVAFSDPYFEIGQVVTVRADDTTIKSYKDLAGKVVGVQTGTTGEKAATDFVKVPQDKLKHYDTVDLAFAALMSGDIDAVIADSATSDNYISKNPDKLKVTGGEGKAAWFTTEQYGIAVKQGDTALLDAINAGLKKAKDQGVIDQLITKWKIAQ